MCQIPTTSWKDWLSMDSTACISGVSAKLDYEFTQLVGYDGRALLPALLPPKRTTQFLLTPIRSANLCLGL